MARDIKYSTDLIDILTFGGREMLASAGNAWKSGGFINRTKAIFKTPIGLVLSTAGVVGNFAILIPYTSAVVHDLVPNRDGGVEIVNEYIERGFEEGWRQYGTIQEKFDAWMAEKDTSSSKPASTPQIDRTKITSPPTPQPPTPDQAATQSTVTEVIEAQDPQTGSISPTLEERANETPVTIEGIPQGLFTEEEINRILLGVSKTTAVYRHIRNGTNDYQIRFVNPYNGTFLEFYAGLKGDTTSMGGYKLSVSLTENGDLDAGASQKRFRVTKLPNPDSELEGVINTNSSEDVQKARDNAFKADSKKALGEWARDVMCLLTDTADRRSVQIRQKEQFNEKGQYRLVGSIISDRFAVEYATGYSTEKNRNESRRNLGRFDSLKIYKTGPTGEEEVFVETVVKDDRITQAFEEVAGKIRDDFLSREEQRILDVLERPARPSFETMDPKYK